MGRSLQDLLEGEEQACCCRKEGRGVTVQSPRVDTWWE